VGVTFCHAGSMPHAVSCKCRRRLPFL
jgi:hypothetical protein